MISPSSPQRETPTHRPLCPVCGGDSIRIRLSIEVDVDVVVEDLVDDLYVIEEMLGDATWDADSPAACPSCEWQGTVGDLHQHVLTSFNRS